MQISVKSSPIFKILSRSDSLVNLQIIIPPHLGYVATLHCETLIPENKRLTINYKLRVATYYKVW